jgi:hypothetical protein
VPRALPPSRSLLVLLTMALALAGCGSSGSVAPGPDPASVVPARTPLYVGALIEPTGVLKTNALADGRKLSHLEEPYEKLLEELQSGGPTHFKWAEVKPWVGQRAGLFTDSIGGSGSALGALTQGLSGSLTASGVASSLTGGETQGALLLDVSDPAGASAFVKAQAAVAGAHPASFHGSSFEVDSKGRALGVVGKFVVIGSEVDLKSVIETAAGGPSLLASTAYSQLSHSTSGTALADIYISPSALLATHTAGKGESQWLGLLDGILSSTGDIYLAVAPTAGSIAVEAVSQPSGSPQQEAAAAKIFGQLPGESWLALGIGDLGKSLGGAGGLLNQLGSLSSAGGLATLLPKVDTKGIDVKRDLLSWMGAAGVFASGSSLLNIMAGVEIDSKNPAASRAAVATLAKLLSGSGGSSQTIRVPGTEVAMTVRSANSPLSIDIADGGGKFVIGLGETSIVQAFKPSSTLASSPTYKTAQETLGAGLNPTLLVAFPTLLGFLEGLNLQENQSLGKVIPYLRSLDTLTAGSGRSGDLIRSRLILGLR